MTRPAASAKMRLALSCALVASVAVALFDSTSARAAASCSSDGKRVTVSMQGGEATLSVDANGKILVDGEPCPLPDQSSATVGNTAYIDVFGSTNEDVLRVDDAEGIPFPPIESGVEADPVEGLVVVGGQSDDTIQASPDGVLLNDTPIQILGLKAITLEGGGGKDSIDASLSGSESGSLDIPVVIDGGPGNDMLTGGPIDDQIFGGDGDDVLDGGAGIDYLNGEDGRDRCWQDDELLSCDQAIVLNPPSGPGDTNVLVSGTGWMPENREIELSILGPNAGEAPLRPFFPKPDGSFAEQVRIPPSGTTDQVRVSACQHCDANPIRSQTEYTVVAGSNDATISITPETTILGQRVVISGANWPSDEQVNLFIDPVDVRSAQPIASAVPDGGFFETRARIRGLSIGTHQVVGCQGCDIGTSQASTEFEVLAPPQPAIKVEPQEVRSGGQIDVLGAAWRKRRGPVSVSIVSSAGSETALASVPVQADGTFDRVIDLPDLAPGPYQVQACQVCDKEGRPVAESSLTIAAAPARWPWIVGAVALAALLIIAGYAARRAWQRRNGNGGPPRAGGIRTIIRESPPIATASADQIPILKHSIRLVPRTDPGITVIEEMRER